MNLVTREELHEVQIKQALLEQAISQIADSTKQIAESVVAFTGIADRFERFTEDMEKHRQMTAAHETELAVMRSHDIVSKVAAHDREMPGLIEIRGWIIRSVLAVVGSVFIAAGIVIFH